MTEITALVPKLLLIVGVLVILTNIIVEVLKKMTWDKMPTNLLAIVVSLVLTLVAFFAYVGYTGMTFAWFHVVAAVIVAFMVAYAAMFGFDKLKEALSKIKDLET